MGAGTTWAQLGDPSFTEVKTYSHSNPGSKESSARLMTTAGEAIMHFGKK